RDTEKNLRCLGSTQPPPCAFSQETAAADARSMAHFSNTCGERSENADCRAKRSFSERQDTCAHICRIEGNVSRDEAKFPRCIGKPLRAKVAPTKRVLVRR